MIDPQQFMAQLSDAAKAELANRSDRAGLIHLAGHVAVILGLGTAIASGMPGWAFLMPFQGCAIIFLFTMEHECTHRTPFATPALNDWVGRVCGFLLLLPFEWFRYFHLAHHRWTNIAGQDPELDSTKPETRWEWLIHVSGLPYWFGMARVTMALAAGKGNARYLPSRALPRIRAEARLLLAGYALVIASLPFSTIALWVWIIPVVLGQPFLRIYLLAEHGDCPRVANMFENTRTTFTNRLIRFFAWNMSFHVEHHVQPNVPFHRLPAMHRLMRDHLRQTAKGYVAFSRAYLARRR